MKTTLLLEIQDKKIILWVDCEIIKEWRAKHTSAAGAPLEFMRAIEKAFAVAGVPVQIEFGDDLK